MKNQTAYSIALVALFFVAATSVGNMFLLSQMRAQHMDHDGMSMDEMRDHFMSLRADIQEEERQSLHYRCCTEVPCIYCIEKTPGHGEGAACDCLADVMNGRHPCGECIGEILEGHGNPLVAEYFAKAIAEETGEEEAIRRIIEDKYGIPVEDQV